MIIAQSSYDFHAYRNVILRTVIGLLVERTIEQLKAGLVYFRKISLACTPESQLLNFSVDYRGFPAA
jgi:hypothetical protein